MWEWETERATQERGRRERELQLRKENQLLKSQIGAACGNLKALGIPAAKVRWGHLRVPLALHCGSCLPACQPANCAVLLCPSY